MIQPKHLLVAALSCLTLACDLADESVDAPARAELGELELGMWPPADAMPDASPDASPSPAPAFAPPPADPIAVKHVEPSETLVIGWLRWALAQPYADGAIADQTGDECGLGQDGPVWFLAGTFGGPVTRECDVPVGKQLFFPLVNRWCVFPSEFYSDPAQIESDLPLIGDWWDDLRDNTCGLTLRVDGQEVLPDFEALAEQLYIRVLDPFEVDLHDEHWATEWFAGGTMPAVGDGHYALIQPLTPGDHTIELGGTICGDAPFSTSASYLLHVGG